MNRGSCAVPFMRWNRKFLPVQQFNRRNGTQELGRSLLDRGELVLRYGQVRVGHVIAAFDSLNLQPAPHSTVLLKLDEQLFHNKWQPLFIASLVWNDHSFQIWINKLSKIMP